eukprot:Em0003g640a
MEAFNGSNNSDICEYTPGSPLPTWMAALQTIFLVSVFIVSLILNVSFTAIVIVHKALHQEDIMLNLVLTVTNICFSALSNIPNIASVVNGGWPLGKVFCYVDGTMNFFLAISRHAFLLAITMDRFGLVMYPFSFRRHRSKTAAVILLVGVLYSAAVSIVFNANVVGCYNFDQNGQLCLFKVDCSDIWWCYSFNVLAWFVVYFFGVVVPFILTAIMFYKAQKIRTAVACGMIDRVEIGGPGPTEIRSPDTRAVMTVALLFGSIAGLTTPYLALLFAKITLPFDTSVVEILIGDLYTLVPIADALVVWRNRDVKECAIAACRRMRQVLQNHAFGNNY